MSESDANDLGLRGRRLWRQRLVALAVAATAIAWWELGHRGVGYSDAVPLVVFGSVVLGGAFVYLAAESAWLQGQGLWIVDAFALGLCLLWGWDVWSEAVSA